MMPNQGAPAPTPQWAITIPAPPADGVHPPCSPITVQGALTPPDANGHQWALLIISDAIAPNIMPCSFSITLRVPWQSADGLGAGIAQILGQLKAAAQAQAGPQLVVPPAGIDLSKLNGNGQGGGGRGR